jgi:hypothetical protein
MNILLESLKSIVAYNFATKPKEHANKLMELLVVDLMEKDPALKRKVASLAILQVRRIDKREQSLLQTPAIYDRQAVVNLLNQVETELKTFL